ncbi:hypothetical protein PV08_08602 [Exophiala spinifera]|uniref:BHLH domain-containing protein n=1 Tax=Exophiala spinifera TaxID=91928 RepID=A0A0D2BQK5_9EURO|nr:uncharacterized protein PV08_08602 [Exophiala spinifera]KIW13414.1 hypothetical protein PV08_08602 [Exophiala spinifera]
MPFRNAYPGHNGSPDFHNQRHAQQLAIVDPDSVDYSGWHEMDFTTAPLNHPSSSIMVTTSSSQQAQVPKYASSMDTDIESLAYLRPGQRQNSTGSSSHHQTSLSGDLYSTGPFSYSQLLNMDADLTSMDQSSLSSSRTDTDSNMINDGSTMTTGSLSGVDSLNTSPPVATLDPISIQLSKSDEKLCPLIAGQVDSCQPSRCGPDAPCMNFTTLPPIEECTSVPCITQSSPNETMITSESVVSLHQRPSLGSRSSTGRQSAGLRRSSTSSGENQIQSVPLPPRNSSKTAAARRQAAARNNSNKKVASVTASEIPSEDEDNDDVDDQMNAKPTAPSKADAKQRAKQAHSLVERKYRENLNAKIAQLHNTLQSSHYGPRANEDGDSDAPAAVPANKVRKSDVLTEAMNYVNQTEVEMRHMENEIQRLGERVRVLEKLVRCEDCSLLKQMVNLQVQAV